jgi:xylan 1,4-beta-xylosidase
MSYWTFTDIFEEAGPGLTPFHGGFGLMNLQDIPKPTFFAYKFLNELGDTELMNADSNSWVCKNKTGVQVLFWNMQLPFNDTTVYNETFFRRLIPASDAGQVNIRVANVPDGKYQLLVYHVGYHSNDPYSAYLEMKSPTSLSLSQEKQIKQLVTGEPVSRTQVTIRGNVFTWNSSVKENDIYLVKLVKL